MKASHSSSRGSPRLVVAVSVLGIGFGALFDGIVFHQVLQWHHLISATQPATSLAGLELNTLADGLFHVVGWVLTFSASGSSSRHHRHTKTRVPRACSAGL